MALDFTVVFSVRQMFGNSEIEDQGLETQAAFVGQQKDYVFRCPRVDPSQQAILLFQSQGSMTEQSLEINGQRIFGGIPSGSMYRLIIPSLHEDIPPSSENIAQWSGNVMLIHERVLQENNVFRIRAKEVGEGVDNFIIDNVVVIFKTGPGLGPVNNTDQVIS